MLLRYENIRTTCDIARQSSRKKRGEGVVNQISMVITVKRKDY